MKKNYIQPSMFAVTLQHQDRILQSISTIDGPIGGGGDGSGMDADVKESQSHNIWDEEW